MYRYYLLLVIYFASSDLIAQNKCPIILIHGFLGWGRDEMAGYYYWGGDFDFQEMLTNEGYEVYTVSVGPISSNYDRAVETFYQIKGGQLDYGNTHSTGLGIVQKPPKKKYDGYYPRWDSEHPIHIIGHSQGGQTARMLEVLLNRVFPDESSELLSNSYTGWIKSITTISTPHNGSRLVPIMLDAFPFALNLAPWLGGINIENIDNLYNFDLEHWGVERYPDESIRNYYKRIAKSPLIETKNICSWDLSPKGAQEFNKTYTTDSTVHYFSYSTYATEPFNSSKHNPTSKMSFHLWPTSLLMGHDSSPPDILWYENDGVCNTISMIHPDGSPYKLYSGGSVKGVWQNMGKLHMDHQAVIGHMISRNEIYDIYALYNNHSQLLYSLP